MKWKDRLLSSSIPLEFEVVKILTNKGFYTDYDFAYQRLDGKEEKEFSIDILSGGYYPFGAPNSIELQIDLNIECKYRNPDVKWLFLPNLQPFDDSNHVSSFPIRFIDEFSEVKLNHSLHNITVNHQSSKGVEVNTSNGEVHDTGIHHGINQLMYSLPVILKSAIIQRLKDHLADVFPYCFCPILVTSAELRLLNKNFSIEEVKNAGSIEDISNEVPFIYFKPYAYPSFVKHSINTFEDIRLDKYKERIEYFNSIRIIELDNVNGVKYEKPIFEIHPTTNLLNSLMKGGSDMFQDILICNLNNLPQLIDDIKQAVEKVGASIEKVGKEKDNY